MHNDIYPITQNNYLVKLHRANYEVTEVTRGKSNNALHKQDKKVNKPNTRDDEIQATFELRDNIIREDNFL